MNKKILIGVGIILILLMLLSITVYFFIKRNDHASFEAKENGLFFNGPLGPVYVSEEILNKSNNNLPNFFEYSDNRKPMNLTDYYLIAKRFINDPFLRGNDNWVDLIDNSTDEHVIIYQDGTIRYHNKYFQSLHFFIPFDNETLIYLALKAINKYRGYSSDLQLETLTTYDQRIEFRQYIDNYKVSGGRGRVVLNIGAGGNVDWYEDTTVTKGKKIVYECPMTNSTTALKFPPNNLGIKQSHYFYELVDCHIVLVSQNPFTEDLNVRWELTIRSIDGKTTLTYTPDQY